MEVLLQTFLGALAITFSTIWLTVAVVNHTDDKKELQAQTIESEEVMEEIIEEVSYEEVDEKISLKSFMKKGNIVKASFEEIS